VRASDTVARLGGDEFVVLLESGRQKDHAHTVANKILAAFSHPFDLEGNVLQIHPSIGTALYPVDGSDAAALLDHADRSMYLCKQAGGGAVQPASAPAVLEAPTL
jgi:diguanylate cyclase (GGDEF)-like protein